MIKVTYISLDPERLETLVSGLHSYACAAHKYHSDLKWINDHHDHPTDLTHFQNSVSVAIGALVEKANELQMRVSSARAANESGITPMGANGTLSYFIPDGKEDTGRNARTYNHVEAVEQAKEDAWILRNYDAGREPPPREWKALVDRLRAHQGDSAYAYVFVNYIGPRTLRNIPIAPTEERFYRNNNPSDRGFSQGQRDEVADAFGHLISTASKRWSKSQAKEFAKRLTKDMNGKDVLGVNKIFSSSRSVDIDGDGKKERVGLDYDDTMLLAVAKRLENKDEEIFGIVHAMTGNTGAATKWLSVRKTSSGGKGSEGEVDAEKTAARTKKLVEQRSIGDNQWTDDWTLLAAQQAVSSSDAPSHGAAQAGIVSGALNTIGEDDVKIELSDKARNAASIAMSAYPYGVQRSAETDAPQSMVSGEMGKYGWSKNLPRQPLLTNKALTNVLGQIGQNDSALARLTGSQEAFNKMQISPGNVPQGNSQYLSSTLTSQSSMRGFMQGAIARQTEIYEADADARTAAWANVASMAVGGIPVPGFNQLGKTLEIGSKFAADVGKSAASEGAKNGITKLYGSQQLKAKDKNSALKAAGVNANRQISGMALLKSGLYSQDELKAVAKIPGVDVGEVLSPEGELKVHTGGPLKGTQSEALIQVVKNLPAENHGALNNVDKNMSDSYESAYDAAHEQPY